MSSVPGIPPNIDLLVGPILLGTIFSWALYGVLLTQTYFYYVSFPTDRRVMQLSVYGLLILDTFQSIAITDLAWGLMSTGWGNLAVLLQAPWSFDAVPIVSGLISMWVQMFFAWRIWVLGGNSKWRMVVILIVLVSLAQGCSAMAAGFRFIPVHSLTQLNLVYPMVSVWLGGSALCDVLIAVSMLYFLIKARSATAHKSTEALLTRLIALTVETGVVTAAVAILDISLFFAFKNNNLHTIPANSLGKIYTNTLLASLNARSPLFSGKMTRRADATWQYAQGSSQGTEATSRGPFYRPQAAVRITTETTKRGDDLTVQSTYDDENNTYSMKNLSGAV